MTTTTSNTQSEVTVDRTASQIIDLIEERGFTTEVPIQADEFRAALAEVIRRNFVLTPYQEGTLAEANAYIRAFQNAK